MNTEIKIGDLTLKNPVTVASGTAGYGEELSQYMDISKIGAVFTKGLSIEPRRGNAGNRIMETPAGVLNSIGLENVGLDKFLEEKLPFIKTSGATAIPNIAGHSVDENVELCRILSRTEGIDAVELNVSCPNVKQGGIAFGTDLDIFRDLMKKARNATDGTLIVKLSPNVTDVTSFAVAAEEEGVDAISAVNTFLGMKINTKRKRPHFNNKVAGLSGPAIMPMALRIVYQICSKVKIPVVGLGGISSFDDMLQFLMAGATAVSIGTMNMIEPAVSERMVRELEEYMEREKIESIYEIIGTAQDK